MLTRNAISIITSGLAGDHKLGSPNDMKAESEDYLWIKSTNGKWFCSNYAEQDSENFISAETDDPFRDDSNHRTVTESNKLIKNNEDIDMTIGNETYGGDICHYTLFIGSGTTQPTIDDYKLESCIVEYTRKQESMYFDAKNLQCQVTLVIEPIIPLTISEVGCYARCARGYSTTDGSNTNQLTLIDRKVLETPLVLNAGDISTLTYTIDFRNLNESTM